MAGSTALAQLYSYVKIHRRALPSLPVPWPQTPSQLAFSSANSSDVPPPLSL